MIDIKLLIAKGMKIVLRPPAIRKSIIDITAKVCSGSSINYCELGRLSYIGNDCYCYHATIGQFCSIGDNCKIGSPSHPLKWVSTSPVFYKGKNCLKKNLGSLVYKEETLQTIIGNDVWIGAGVLIKSGVEISDGAVIGMGAVVVHNVGPYEIWAGNPARLIRKRFPDETIQDLLAIQWWNFEMNDLARISEHINDVSTFIEEAKYGKKG